MSSGHARAMQHHDEEVRIPVSAGIPTGVRISFLACVVLALFVLGLVIYASPVNHVWPSSESLKFPLTQR